MSKRGIILAGGSGSRLFPTTAAVNKHLLPVYDKPMIYYSLSVLMLADVREFLLITTPRDQDRFKELLRDGHHLGIDISYATQDAPNGIADSFLIGEEFVAGEPVFLILGDNILFGVELGTRLRAIEAGQDAVIFSYPVKEPERYGVVEVDPKGNVISLVEKPANSGPGLAIPGLYLYPGDVAEKAKALVPSGRGELEITDLNNLYLKEGRIRVVPLGRGFAWLDAGTETALLDASNFVAAIEHRQGLKIGCIEEIAWQLGWIDTAQLIELGRALESSDYGKYILWIAERK